MVIAIIALSVDGGGQIRERMRAQALAAEAARAGGQMIDIADALAGDPTVLDEGRARAAALAYLADAAGQPGHPGSLTYSDETVTFLPGDHVIQVSVTIRYSTLLLSALPIASVDHLDATGSASARPVPSP